MVVSAVDLGHGVDGVANQVEADLASPHQVAVEDRQAGVRMEVQGDATAPRRGGGGSTTPRVSPFASEPPRASG